MVVQDKISENENAMIRTPKMVQYLESENKSERFTLHEPPILRRRPVKPNCVKIIMLDILLAIAS